MPSLSSDSSSATHVPFGSPCMRRRGSVVVGAAFLVQLAMGCDAKPTPALERTLYFRGEPVAHVQERVDPSRGGLRRVQRTSQLSSGDEVSLEATVDSAGIALEATYRRPGKREIRLERGQLVDAATGVARSAGGAVVLLELLRLVQPQTPLDVVFVDLSSGDVMRGSVERKGPAVVALDASGAVFARVNVEGLRTGPGSFFEGDAPAALDAAPVDVPVVGTGGRGVRLVGVDDVLDAMVLDGSDQHRASGGTVLFGANAARARAPTDADSKPSLFVESEAPPVKAFAARHATSGQPLADATALAEAVHAFVDPRKADEPPSALRMLSVGGDCDGAAALLTAALRAAGHPARPVTGYRRIAGRFVPHAWVEVYTSDGWMLVDATVPRVGGDGSHLKLFDGLGSALTMGRVLGRLRLELIL